MNNILIRTCTLILLMMFSMGVQADVKVLFGENGDDEFTGKGGTIEVKQAPDEKDETKVIVTLTVTPKKNYSISKDDIKVYAVLPASVRSTRGLEISNELTLDGKDPQDLSEKRDYTITLDSKLNLWVRTATFTNLRKGGGATLTCYFANNGGYNQSTTTNNFYMVPAADPHQTNYNDAYYSANYNLAKGDPERPFITTYKTDCDNNSVWQIISTDDGHFYIKHWATGKYLIYEPPYSNLINRKSVHLQTTTSPGDNAKFDIITTGNEELDLDDLDLESLASKNYDIIPISLTSGNRYLNPAKDNANNYYGSGSDNNAGGLIGVWKETTGNSIWHLEETVLPPTFTVNADGTVEISSVTGTTVHYLTDGNNPTATDGEYDGAITPTNEISVIKAIAVRETDGKVSAVVTLPLQTYTYYIVNRSGDIAVKCELKQPVGKTLSSYLDIPAAIQSPYLDGETVLFYSFDEAYSSTDQLSDENQISKTPATDANIYVTYTTTGLSEKFLKLHGASAFNITVNSKCIYDDSGLTVEATDFSSTTTTKNHLWYFDGDDPYAVQIKNFDTGNLLQFNTTEPALSVATAPTNKYFIVMDGSSSGDGIANGQMELMAATGDATYYRIKNDGSLNIDNSTTTGDASLQVRAYPVSVSTRYHLIDKAGKLIEGNIESVSSELGLPDEWKSPLVSEYHYYSTPNQTGDTYAPSGTVTSPFDATDIYVTYDVGNDIDITGGKNYMLKFLDGDTFNQEDGKDGINETATKAIYPYNNGDFNLYVYGQAQWDKQLGDGASTRTRWLWKIVSSNVDNADPYHVIIKSNQNQSIKYDNENKAGTTFLRTYKPEGYASVVTGTTYKNTGGYPGSLPTDEPTEYMILGTSISSMTLKTVNPVDGSRRIVDSFEQYWKNSPTVEGLVGQNPDADNTELSGRKWHRYEQWAYSAPWGGGSKTYAQGDHWFQTIKMGTGENAGKFTVEAVDLAPQVILIDQHGWEIMRIPLSDTETLRKYDSPMVEKYQWYPTALKTEGYHKYRVSDPKIKIYKYAQKPNSTSYDWIESGTYYENPELDVNDENKYLYTSATLTDNPYGHITTPPCEKPKCTDASHLSQPDKVKTDFYVTYTVKSQYANAYHGAATEDAVTATPYLLKQNNTYATYGGSGTTIGTVATKPSRENLTNNIEWYLKPNFNIDREMGYKYAGETGAQDGALSQAETEADNYDEGRNGFDPYNLQIQNRAYPLRYFTANTTGSALSAGLWTGTSATVALQNMSTKQTAAGYDQTTLNITNATFMVVDDGNGNMRLMPRFDHGMVMQSFGTLATQAAAASAGDEGTGTQTLYLESVAEAKEIHSSDEITDPNGFYLLAEDFTFTSDFTSISNFTGVIDGQLHTISAPSVPLVKNATDAIIRNVILDNVTISSGDSDGNTGAIACVATGATRIYNCGILSGTVSGTGYTGGLVGLLNYSGTDGARVINCYSYADIKGGSVRAGIVGYNNYASKYNDLKTMVMNCMFYGDIDVVDELYPIYGGNEISNDYNSNTANRLNNYNYFLYEAPYSAGRHISGSHYNCALAAEERFLVRFEFYRHLLNSTRELAAWYATGSTSDAHSTMAKWVLDKSIAPYPILKVQGYYPSVVNYDPDNTYDADKQEIVARTSVSADTPNKGRYLGDLNVTISTTKSDGGQSWPTGASVTTTSLTLKRTDKDFDNYNFNYDKVQLPYYNDIGDGNYTGNRVVTGWKITSMTNGTQGTYTETDYDYPNYNYADRDTYAKDLYSVSGRVFAQGAYFNVPTGVTGITIEPYWGIAAYLSDACYDRYGYNNTDDLTQVGGGQRYTNDTNCPVLTGNQKVYTTASSAISALTGASGTATVYDYALVLVGNYHHHATTGKDGPELSSGTKPFTIMSIDLNEDNEPDYCLIYRSGKNKEISPIRFDFITVPGMVMAHKMASHSDLGIPGNCCPKGWFEITTTGLIKYGQFEHSYGSKTVSPLIFMGGIIDQFVTNNTSDKYSDGAKTTYMLFGDNVWFKLLSNGSHMDKKRATPHRPISMVGGEYEKVYLSGYFLQNDSKCTEGGGDRNAEGYIDGGRFGEVAGASQEIIDGDVTWMIDHADIHSFFGGGINEGRAITGDIKTTIKNSRVDEFYGGPKFGNMAEGKSVTTNATGCIFGVYYGAGYGGTAISQVNLVGQQYQSLNYDWKSWVNGRYESSGNANYRGKLNTGNKGISIDYECEFFAGSSGNVARLYGWFAAFSTAQTNDVNSTLEKCTVINNFYGGGALGRVTGTATSELNNCIVYGNVFGAGYSASIPTVTVRNAGGLTEEPKYNTSTGVYEEAVYPGTTEYTWEHVNSLSNGNQALADDGDHHIIKTTKDITALGRVATVELTIKGNSVIGTDGDITGEKGNVFGGGESSAVDGNTTVNIEGNTQVLGNVFGGGDEGDVEGSAEVNIRETPATP